jgi:Phytanoyl-CoA dioxygenase (PhyH)
MSQVAAVLRKNIDAERLLALLPQAASIEYWRSLNPTCAICAKPHATTGQPVSTADPLDDYLSKLREDGYFQTSPVVPAAVVQQMRTCVESVRAAGFPPTFALVYDVFYDALLYSDPIFTHLLGPGYRLIPNFWVYYIETSDEGKGFEPHRDAEYENTVDEAGLPTVLTFWTAITDATPLNSCMYLVPSSRDPYYNDALNRVKVPLRTDFPLENIRALPAAAGTVSSWNQYLLHWGARSSRRAATPRISYAAYLQRRDVPPVDDVWYEVPVNISFPERLGLICRGLLRYSYAKFEQSDTTAQVVALLKKYEALLATRDEVSL